MKNIFILAVSMFFIGTAFAQNNGCVAGVSEKITPNFIFAVPIIGAPQTIMFITDRFCEPIISTILDSTGFTFLREDCVNGPCTIHYVYFQNKKLEIQSGEILFHPQKPDPK